MFGIGSVKRVLCLDWDPRYMRFVVARASRSGIVLEDAHAHRIPTGVDAEDPAALGKFIAESLARHNVKIKQVMLDVPRDLAVINRLKLPPTPPSELAAAVRFQAMRELPFPLEDAQVDFVVMTRDESGQVTEVLLAAVRNEILKRLTETCEAAGLTAVRVGLRPYANLLAVNHVPGMAERRVLFVDIGPTKTEIDVIRGHELANSRSADVVMPLAGADQDFQDSRISSRTEMATLKIADELQEESVKELLLAIQRTTVAYRAMEPESEIEHIIVAGGTGAEYAVMQGLEERFSLPALLFDPTVVLGVAPSEAVKLRAFAATLGLAWGAAGDTHQSIDFLNPKKPIPPQYELKRRLRIGGIAAAVLVLAGATWIVRTQVQLSDELASLQKQNADLVDPVKELRKLEVRNQEIDDWRERSRQVVWLAHVQRLLEAIPDPGKQTLFTDMRCELNENGKAQVSITLKCSQETANEYAKRVNAIEEKGKRLYHAEQRAWRAENDAKFKGRVDIVVDLLEAEKFNGEKPARENARKKRLAVS